MYSGAISYIKVWRHNDYSMRDYESLVGEEKVEETDALFKLNQWALSERTKLSGNWIKWRGIIKIIKFIM